MVIKYQQLDIDLDMGTNYLTNESAYFLGGIFAANQSFEKDDKIYWVSPVGYNQITKPKLEEHFTLIRSLSRKLSSETLMTQTIKNNELKSAKKNKTMGFCTFFEGTKVKSLEDLIPSIEEALINSPDEVKRCFIVGIFDGRGSIDHNMITVDCDNHAIGEFLCSILGIYKLNPNYNNSNRYRADGEKRRNYQLRISGFKKFIQDFGLISPQKFEDGIRGYDIPNTYMVKNQDEILNGLKRVVKI